MIVPLDPRHADAMVAFIDDFHQADERSIPAFFCPHDASIEAMTTSLANMEASIGLGEGMVPTTTRFVERDGELLGVVNIRHCLNDNLLRFGGHVGYSVRPTARRQGVATELLAFGLDELRRRDVTRALLTCAPTNIGSVKTITRAGGVLEETYFNAVHQRDVSRYWVALG